MTNSYPTDKIPASSEYVLSVIQDNHRQQCQYDPEAERDVLLTFDTTVAEWRSASDLVGWKKLGEALNVEWEIECASDQWFGVLEPAKERTLRDVCNLIAVDAVRDVVRPAKILGSTCATAGAFLTVRSMLQREGADDELIAPSTELASYTRLYTTTFLGPISRLAPNRLPPVVIHKPQYWAACIGLVLSWGVTMCGHWDNGLTIIGVVLLAFFYALLWIAAKSYPSAVEFGDLRTFRDLAVAITGRGTTSDQLRPRKRP